jgi:hypothetical protein
MRECDSVHIVRYHGSYLKGRDLWVSAKKFQVWSSKITFPTQSDNLSSCCSKKKRLSWNFVMLDHLQQ